MKRSEIVSFGCLVVGLAACSGGGDSATPTAATSTGDGGSSGSGGSGAMSSGGAGTGAAAGAAGADPVTAGAAGAAGDGAAGTGAGGEGTAGAGGAEEPPGVCVPFTCATEETTCGTIGDGCGDQLDCGACTTEPDPPTCQPVKCDKDECGKKPNGCGGTLDCGECTYQNPVLDSNGDPHCIEIDGTYYLYQPRASVGEVVAFTSKDLVHWKSRGTVFSNRKMKVGGETPGDLWAPEVLPYKGSYYLYFVNGMTPTKYVENRDVAVVKSDDPLDFTGGAPKVLLDDDYVFLDPSPFVDPKDGEMYLLFKRRTADLSSSEIRIRSMAGPMQMGGGDATTLVKGSDIPGSEGIVEHPEMFVRNGRYFFFFNYGHGGKANSYHIAYKSSGASPTSKFTDRHVLFAPNLSPAKGLPIYAPGALSIVRDGKGRDWAVYRQKTDATEGFGDRKVAIDRVTFGTGNVDPKVDGRATRHVVLPAPKF